MASAFENRMRRTIEMAGTDGQAGPVPVMTAPVASSVSGEGRGVVKLSGGDPVWLKPSDPIVHDIPLTHSLLARVGADLTFARTGASAIVDCYGSLQFCRSGEARFWGARRVENKLVDDTFTSSVTLAANTTKALRTDVLGPYRNRRNVYELTRTSGTGAIFTLNSASYRAGQHTYSVWLGGDGATQYTLAIQRNGGDAADLATVTVTPPAQGRVRYAVFATIPDDGLTYKVQLRSTTAAVAVRMSCAQFEWTHGQSGAPSEYVPRGSTYDVAPWFGAGVDGVRYFDTYNPCTVTSGIVTQSTASVLIESDKLKGLLIGPTRVNKFYHSRDVTLASWTVTGLTAGSKSNSVLLGTESLRKIAEDTSTGVHGVSQSWKGTLPSTNAGPSGQPVMITIAGFFSAAERSIVKIGFADLNGVEKFAYVDVAKQKVLSESGDVYKTHITPIGDLVRVSFTDKCGTGSTTPVGFFRLAAVAGTESYAGVAGNGMSVGAVSFERTDHACIYLGDTGTSTPGGTGDDTDALVFAQDMGQNDWTVDCEATPMYDSDSQSKSSWSYVWYATKTSNQRFGCGIRPKAYGGAVVEEYVGNPVFDCYFGPDGVGVPQINDNTGLPQEVFDVANALHITPALQTVRWQIALHPVAYDGASNIAMYVGATQGELDFNGRNVVSKVALGVTCRLGYKGTPIDEKCVKNFRVYAQARNWSEMAAAV